MTEEKFYAFLIGTEGKDMEDAWAYCNQHAEEYSLSDLEMPFSGIEFNTSQEANKFFKGIDEGGTGKSVPMDEIKAIQEELHELVWGDKSRLWDNDDLKALLGKLQMLTD